jgi:hypothetical protein
MLNQIIEQNSNHIDINKPTFKCNDIKPYLVTLDKY